MESGGTVWFDCLPVPNPKRWQATRTPKAHRIVCATTRESGRGGPALSDDLKERRVSLGSGGRWSCGSGAFLVNGGDDLLGELGLLDQGLARGFAALADEFAVVLEPGAF